jgi:hypothetical protein
LSGRALSKFSLSFCTVQRSEVTMEKQHSRPLTKKLPPVNDDSYDISSLKIGRRTDTGKKPSREDVSLCINIWARLYRLDGGTSKTGKLHLPSPPWRGNQHSPAKRHD